MVSNDSSSSFLASAKRANGTALRQSTTVEDAPDPEEVLGRILKPLLTGGKSATISEDDLDLDFDFRGLALRDLAESDMDAAQPLYRSQRVEECTLHMFPSPYPVNCPAYDKTPADRKDKAKFEELHRNIRACDDILNSVEANLASFRNDLATVSADIETLQARSTGLNIRLENRKAVEKGLGPVVDELSVSPVVVSKISEGHIDESWIKVLAEVDKRAASYNKNSKQGESKAVADLGPLLEKLVQKVGNILARPRNVMLTNARRLRESETSLWPRSKP